jgi:oxygen-independent coproporphyrinogen-3 oxidase
MPEADLVAEMYDSAGDLLGAAGFEQYELSNWARPGHASRHNLSYWTDRDYLGIGAGAHGYIRGDRYENLAHPRAYIAAVRAEWPGPGSPAPQVARAYRPTREQAMVDWLSLRLRLVAGVPTGAFEAKFGVDLDAAVGAVLDQCLAAGVLEPNEPLRLTPRGRQLHGEVAALLLAHLEEASRHAAH